MNIIKSDRNKLREIIQENKLKIAIKNAQGRVVLTEIVDGATDKYEGICNAKLMKSFGSDLITLKKYDYQRLKLNRYNEYLDSGAVIGLNFEVKSGEEISEIDTLIPENIAIIKDIKVDYLVVTIYPQQRIKISEIAGQLQELRKEYHGVIILNYYVITPEIFKNEIKENIELIREISDAVCIPIPGTVPGINTIDVQELVALLHKSDLLAVGTICTSQESANSYQLVSLGFLAKQLGFDIHMFGDAAACKIPEELNVFEYSIAIRGKRHTYYRMVN